MGAWGHVFVNVLIISDLLHVINQYPPFDSRYPNLVHFCYICRDNFNTNKKYGIRVSLIGIMIK